MKIWKLFILEEEEEDKEGEEEEEEGEIQFGEFFCSER